MHATSTVEELLASYKTNVLGLTKHEAISRRKLCGYNEISKKRKHVVIQFLEKFKNPLVVLLLFVSVFSFYSGSQVSAIIVAIMAFVSVVMSFLQEYKAGKEIEKLQEIVRTTATVYRDKKLVELPIRELVPGDIVYIAAGDIVPADVRIISCKDLFINQSTITGESFPVEKFARPARSGFSTGTKYSNIAFQGTNVVSGSGLGVVILTGTNTMFGAIATKSAEATDDTAFEKGINDFTYLLLRFMVVLVVFIFIANAIFKGNDVAGAIAFSLAVAVGLTPEMLPLIMSVNLANGAIEMSKKKVIVKKLASMQNFGSMDVLCTDKTGTLTRGEVILEKHIDLEGKESVDVLYYAYVNSYYQTGLKNLLDKAILKHEEIYVENIKKVDEIPYDFSRKMMSVVVELNGRHVIISKGAPEEIIKRCNRYELKNERYDAKKGFPESILKLADGSRTQGYRVLGVAYKEFDKIKQAYGKDDESDLVLIGFMLFLDPPKPSSINVIKELNKLGIELKILTGDNELVTESVCKKIGLSIKGVVTGDQLDKLGDTELQELVQNVNIFSRLTPLQKERVITALKKNGHVVGYMGDGINDAPALKASDVGISVDNAVDIAKESADIILLKKSLSVLKDGVIEGRKVFGNIMKYIRMGASSNLGNMISQTGASVLLKFYPMTPLQIILNNFLYDISQIAIPSDSVDDDQIKKPRHWDIEGIKKFMIFMGPISSIFDFLTFFVMLFLKAPVELFQTVWFLESLSTQTLAIHVIRTSKLPYVESKPSNLMIVATLGVVVVGALIVLTPIGSFFGFVIPPIEYAAIILIILITYLIVLEAGKQFYIKQNNFKY